MLTRFELAAALVFSAVLGSSALVLDARAAGGRRSGPEVIVSTVRDSARDSAIDAKQLADLDCQAEQATAQAKLARGLASCLRRDARSTAGFDLRACEDASFQKYLYATTDLPCHGASDVVGTYSCQGVLCTCHGDDCGEMFDSAACGDSVSCEIVGEEAVCSCLPSL